MNHKNLKNNTKRILILTIKNATQAKLVLKPGMAIVKIPGGLTKEQETELRNKLLKVADLNKDTKQFLKLYYKVGTPFLFLNQKLAGGRKETAKVYNYAEL